MDLRTKIVESVGKGVSKCETARRFRVNCSTVKRYLKRFARVTLLPLRRSPANIQSWMSTPCCCLRKTSKLGPRLPITREVSSSMGFAKLG